MKKRNIVLILFSISLLTGCSRTEKVDIDELKYSPESYYIYDFIYTVFLAEDSNEQVVDFKTIDEYDEMSEEEKYYSIEESLNFIVENQINGGYVEWKLEKAPKIIESNYPAIYKKIEKHNLFYKDVFTAEEKTKWLMDNDINLETTDKREFNNHLNYNIASYDSWQLYSELREDLDGQISTHKYIERPSVTYVLEKYLDIEKSLQDAINKQLNGAIIYWDDVVGVNIIKADYPKIYKQIEENDLLNYKMSKEELNELLDKNGIPRKLDISEINYDLNKRYPWEIRKEVKVENADELSEYELIAETERLEKEAKTEYDNMSLMEKYEYSNEYLVKSLDNGLKSRFFGSSVEEFAFLKENYPHIYVHYNYDGDFSSLDLTLEEIEEKWKIKNHE